MGKHEKDFFPRSDKKYVEKLNVQEDEFIAFLDSDSLEVADPEYRLNTQKAGEAYRKHFNIIAAIDEEIGLTPNDGFAGILAAQAADVEPNVDFIRSCLAEETEKVNRLAVMTTAISAASI